MARSPSPLAQDPAWDAFREAYYKVLFGHVPGRADHAQVVRSHGQMLERLVRLAPAPQGRDAMLAGLFDAGCDLGRWVYARRAMEDAMGEAVEHLSGALHEAGFGTIEVVDAFVREATLRFRPSALAGKVEEGLLDAFLAGVLQGSLGQAFNSAAEVRVAADLVFHVRLGPGRDVNHAGPRVH